MVYLKNYQKWINENYPTFKKALGKCREATEEMQKAFPELRRVPGEITYLAVMGKHTELHWWLEDELKNIIDPTIRQYLEVEILNYKEYPKGHEAFFNQRKKCMNCGKYHFVLFTEFCSQKCGIEMFI